MKRNQESMYVCNLCKKSFLTGKMLGGHMKVHGVRKSITDQCVNLESSSMDSDGYDLRGNPKKSWKFSGLDLDDDSSEAVKCRVCGKQFGSPRSLYGHMRHHSAPERNGIHCEECNREFQSLKSLSNHKRRACSGTNPVVMTFYAPEIVNPVRRKRSSRTRYKITPNSSFTSLNESAVSGFENEQHEVEEVAMTLIMMSRGEREGCDVFYGNELVKLKKPREEKLCSFDLDCEDKTFGCSECDCEMRCDGEKDDESGVELGHTEIEKGIHGEMNSNLTDAESVQDLMMGEAGLDVVGVRFEKSIPGSQARFGDCDAKLGEDPCDKLVDSIPGSEIMEDTGKKVEFRCKICKKTFTSYQSLGGHQTQHRKGYIDAKIDNCENDIQTNSQVEATGKFVKLECIQDSVKQETDVVAVKDCKAKEHKCQICFKVFLSGRALGGHKRAHLAKSREEKNIAMKQEVSGICGIVNVNLPCMVAAEANGDVGFESWWAGSGHKHEPLVV